MPGSARDESELDLRTYVDDVQRLVNRRLGVERKSGVDLSRDTAGYNLQDFAAELHEKSVQRGIDLLFNALAMPLAILDGLVDELSVLRLLRGGEDQRRIGGGVLWLVFGDGGKVTRIADNGLQNVRNRVREEATKTLELDAAESMTYSARGFQLIERARHDGCYRIGSGLCNREDLSMGVKLQLLRQQLGFYSTLLVMRGKTDGRNGELRDTRIESSRKICGKHYIIQLVPVAEEALRPKLYFCAGRRIFTDLKQLAYRHRHMAIF